VTSSTSDAAKDASDTKPDAMSTAPGEVTPWENAAREFAAWRDGDPGALDRLVRLLTPVLWQVARAYGLEREAAEDVVQTTWLALVRGADSVRDPQAVLRWATTTARREAWRVARTSSKEDVAEPTVLDSAAPPVAGPEGAVLAGQSSQVLWRHVALLSLRCQRLLRIIAFDARPNYSALSAEMGMAVGSIGPTRARCLDKLRASLAADPDWA
jgi:RNA polymerase sigma factor (sigma-70 family)